ncbi:hypothetical protein [uncultured Friedmanniella sp.]|uniref:hypothetical protein n=1 Tax=uncultured Friedmanniella sp. TaxID=335381 RepID=UPI0035CBC43D
MTTVSIRATRRYTRDLTMWLQLRDVDGARIGQIVAEVESHAAEAGEPPEQAFGPARAYASQFGEQRPRRLLSPSNVLIALVGGLGGWLLASGFLHVLEGERYLGLPGWLVMLGGAAVLAGLFWLLPANFVVDPRRGPRRGGRAAMGAQIALMFAGLLGLIWVLALFARG